MELENPQKTVNLEMRQKDLADLRACIMTRLSLLVQARDRKEYGTHIWFSLQREIEDLSHLDTIVGLKEGAIK